MSDQPYQNEQLSCFMDGELKDLDAVTNALGNREVHACWRRYHVIRDILRDSRPVRLPNDFCVRLMQALESEPAIFNPRMSRPRKPSFTRHILKPVAGLAIAASVATVTVVLWQNVYLSPATDSYSVAANTPNTPSRDLPKVLAAQNPGMGLPGVAKVADEDGAASEEDSLNAYLIRHMEYTSAGGGTGMLPYVRLAGYDNSQ